MSPPNSYNIVWCPHQTTRHYFATELLQQQPILKATLLQSIEGVEDIIIDGVELNIQHPQDNDEQKAHYGEKNYIQ